MIVKLEDNFKKDLGDINKKIKINNFFKLSEKSEKYDIIQSIWDEDSKILQITLDFTDTGIDNNSIKEFSIKYDILYSNNTNDAITFKIGESDYLSPEKNIFRINLKSFTILSDIVSTITDKDIKFLEKTGLDIGYSIFLLEENSDNKLVTKDSFYKYLYKESNKNKSNNFGINYINQVGEDVSRDILYKEYKEDKFFPKFIGNINILDNEIFIGNQGGMITLTGVIGYSELKVVNNKIIEKRVGYQDLRELKCSLITDLNNYSDNDPKLEIKDNRIIIPSTNDDLDWKFKIKVSADFINYDNSIVCCSKEYTIIRTKTTITNEPWTLNFEEVINDNYNSKYYIEENNNNGKKEPVVIFKNILDTNDNFIETADNNINLDLTAVNTGISDKIIEKGLEITYDYLEGYEIDFIKPEELFNVFFYIDLDNIKQDGVNITIPIKRYPKVAEEEGELDITKNLENLVISDGKTVDNNLDQTLWFPQLVINDTDDIKNYTPIIKTTISCNLGEEYGGIYSTNLYIMNEPILVSKINSRIALGNNETLIIGSNSIELKDTNSDSGDIYSGTASISGKSYSIGWKKFDETNNESNCWFVQDKGKHVNILPNIGFLETSTSSLKYGDSTERDVSTWEAKFGTISFGYSDYIINDIEKTYPEFYDFPDTTSVTIGILNNLIFKDKDNLRVYKDKLGNKINDWKIQILIPKKKFDLDIEQSEPIILGKKSQTGLCTDTEKTVLEVSSIFPIKIESEDEFSNIPKNKIISGTNKYKYQINPYNPPTTDDSYSIGKISYKNGDRTIEEEINIEYENAENQIFIIPEVYNNNNEFFIGTGENKTTNNYPKLENWTIVDYKDSIKLDRKNNILVKIGSDNNNNEVSYVCDFYATGVITPNEDCSNYVDVKATLDVKDDKSKETYEVKDIVSKLTIKKLWWSKNNSINKFPIKSEYDILGTSIITTSPDLNIKHCPLPPILRDKLGNILPEIFDIITLPPGKYLNECELEDQVYETILSPYNENYFGIFEFKKTTNNYIKGLNINWIKPNEEDYSDGNGNGNDFEGEIKYTIESSKQLNNKTIDQSNLVFTTTQKDELSIDGVKYNHVGNGWEDFNTFESKLNISFIKNLDQEYFTYNDISYNNEDLIEIDDLNVEHLESLDKSYTYLRLKTPIYYKKCNRTDLIELTNSEKELEKIKTLSPKIENYVGLTTLGIANETSISKNYRTLSEFGSDFNFINISNIPIIVDMYLYNITTQTPLYVIPENDDYLSKLCWRNISISVKSTLSGKDKNDDEVTIEKDKTIKVLWKGITKYLKVKVKDTAGKEQLQSQLLYALGTKYTHEVTYNVEGKTTSLELYISPEEVFYEDDKRKLTSISLKDNLYIPNPPDGCGFDINEENRTLTLLFPENNSFTEEKSNMFTVIYGNIKYEITIKQAEVNPWELELINGINSTLKISGFKLEDEVPDIDDLNNSNAKVLTIHSTGYHVYLNKSDNPTEEDNITTYQNFGILEIKSNHNLVTDNKIKISCGYRNGDDIISYNDTAFSAIVKSTKTEEKEIVKEGKTETEVIYTHTINLKLPTNINLNNEKPLDGYIVFNWGDQYRYVLFKQGYLVPSIVLNNITYRLENRVTDDNLFTGFNGFIGTESNPIELNLNNNVECTIQFLQREVENNTMTLETLPVISYLDEPQNEDRYSVVTYDNDPWIIELQISEDKYIPASYVLKSGNNTDIQYKNRTDFPKLIHSCEVNPLYHDKVFRIKIDVALSLNRIKKFIQSREGESLDNLNNYITTSDINSKINSPFRFSFWLQNKTNND